MSVIDARKWNQNNVRKFQERLLGWYVSQRRILPWRSHPTPYRVWLAEVMLQQTQVQTVLPYYDRFLDRFPDIKALAAASEDDVLSLWAGLGYYRRARNLLRAARKIVAERKGRFPEAAEEIRRLPGVGRYTAAAIRSIAFHQADAVVDGNVRRVIGRLHGATRAPEGFFWEEAGTLLARDRPADFNQALMELGALICTPSNPRCSECPVRALCSSGRRGWISAVRRSSVRASVPVRMVLLILECQGEIVLGRNSGADFIPGSWGLPMHILNGRRDRPHSAARTLAGAILGCEPRLRVSVQVHHAITYRRILAHTFHARIPPPRPPLMDTAGFEWVPASGAARFLTSSLFHKSVAASGLKI